MIIRKSYWLFIVTVAFLASCKSEPPKEINHVHIKQGKTMGTYYNVRYVSSEEIVTINELDSLLIALNQELSTYIPNSTISQINTKSQASLSIDVRKEPHFSANYLMSREMYNLSEKYFDPTLNPLVNFWGFGYDKRAFAQKDTSLIPELLSRVSMDKWSESLSGDTLLSINKPKNASLDFSAIAKGYGVDELASFLSNKGLSSYFVDIGGEVRAKGVKPQNNPWVIGVNRPMEDSAINEAEFFLNIKDYAVATSGNYRNFYEEGGKKYSHTINPFTGKSERSNLLSATIVHKECARADALATACMVRGLEKAKNLLISLSDYEALFIFSNENGEMKTWQTKGFDRFVL